MNDKIEHPKAKDMRDQIALQDKTIEMLAGDRRWLEEKLEQALADKKHLLSALKNIEALRDGIGNYEEDLIAACNIARCTMEYFDKQEMK